MRPADFNPFHGMGRLFEQLPFDGEFAGHADIRDDGDEYIVTMDLPGYDEDAINIKLDGRKMRITVDAMTDGNSWEQRRSVSQAVRFPTSVDDEAAHAEYNNGLLTVHVPKVEQQSDGTSIPIN